VHITPVGETRQDILEKVSSELKRVYPSLEEIQIESELETPSKAYDSERKQYQADEMLEHVYLKVQNLEEGKVLGVTPKDLYSGNLNFVFGQARCPGKACIISLHRLRPEFYGQGENNELYVARAAKEAAHELGHTFGLGHCTNPECVMSFSNSIVDVDRKELKFCEECGKRLSG